MKPSSFPIFVRPIDPNLPKSDLPRLTGQNAIVLDLLKRGPITIHDVLPLGITRLSARIQDIEAAGYKIESVRVGTVAQYSLKGKS
jgi:hypothetical protein